MSVMASMHCFIFAGGAYLTYDGICILVEELQDFLQAPEAADAALEAAFSTAILTTLGPDTHIITPDYSNYAKPTIHTNDHYMERVPLFTHFFLQCLP